MQAQEDSTLSPQFTSACALLHYLPEFSTIICTQHGGIRNWEAHLNRSHSVPPKICNQVGREKGFLELPVLQITSPRDITYSTHSREPIALLGDPIHAWQCKEQRCGYISTNQRTIAQHCNKEHQWRSSPAAREHWQGVKVQTLFRTSGYQRYFTVATPSSGTLDPDYTGTVENVSLNPETTTILAEYWNAQQQRLNAYNIAEAIIPRTDRTGWFTRNGWQEHLGKHNLKQLYWASRLPDRYDTLLQQAVRVVDLAMEQGVAGLSTLPLETCRWLRSPKKTEIETRPMGRLQNKASQQRYTGYLKRFTCYCLRVAQAICEEEITSNTQMPTAATQDPPSSSSGSDLSTNTSTQPTIRQHPLHDAVALFPWQENQLELAMSFVQSLNLDNESTQIQKLIKLLGAFIFQHISGNQFSSGLVHFLAILGINSHTHRLRRAEDYSGILAGMVYCLRVIAVEAILPSATREQQGQTEREFFHQQRENYLVDGSYSPFSIMISLLAYAKHIAFNKSNEADTLWSQDYTILYFRGRPLVIERFKSMVLGLVEAGQNNLWEDLMFVPLAANRFSLPIATIQDDVRCEVRGYSFLTNKANNLGNGFEWTLNQLLTSSTGQQMRAQGMWTHSAVRKFIKRIDSFLELLFLLVHITGGQPARGTEIASARWRNDYAQDRNIYVIDGQVAFITRYNKTQSQWDQPKIIPRFLPSAVGQILLLYLVYICPLREYLCCTVLGNSYSDYLWSTDTGAWEPDWFTHVMQRETGTRLGCTLGLLEYRHAISTIGRQFIGKDFRYGTHDRNSQEDPEELEETELESGIDLQAGRTERIGLQSYGVPMDMVKNLSSRSIHFFQALSNHWHEFLGLESSEPHTRNSSGQGPSKVSMTLPLISGHPTLRHQPQSIEHPGINSQPPTSPVERPVKRLRLRQASVSETSIKAAMSKALNQPNPAYKSAEQAQALGAVVSSQTPVVVVLPTGGGKSLLFLAPACLEDPGVSVVVLPFRELLNNMKERLIAASIPHLEWSSGEELSAPVVLVSADIAGTWPFIKYAGRLVQQGILRRIVVDECHLIFTSSDYRERLATLRNLRSLQCPFLFLTATQPPCLEHELSEAMLIRTPIYIRAPTVRPNIRYLVHICTPGKLVEYTINLCKRWLPQLKGKKGIIYCRYQSLCERVAQELGCGFYHGNLDPETRSERVASWLEHGGFIVATSALGTGVDFPGIICIVHLDQPYGMIDFAQESGRGGRFGEAVDSVIVVGSKNPAPKPIPGRQDWKTLDQDAMQEFIWAQAGVCRRAVMSEYLDGQATNCTAIDAARCDHCGEGVTEWHSSQQKDAQEEGVIRSFLEEMAGSCLACNIAEQGNNLQLPCLHTEPLCTASGESASDFRDICRAIRRNIQYTPDTHTCWRCGLSQYLCATGTDSSLPCQWPHVLISIVAASYTLLQSDEVLQQVGFKRREAGDISDVMEYCAWVGQKHSRRIWGKLMSNGMAVFISIVLQCQSRKVIA
ncbi:hypothetical protein HBI60_255780 [Parastagonospora nodorum]|nr:hypothetical protein HBI30_246870 [Parastagonospora nodorum]KAH6383629.1 hypothetical protein HBI60_255780 [Parastagonospora nodorum]